MFEYIDDESLLTDIKMIMKIPELRAALFHRIEEYKDTHAGTIQKFRELKEMIEPEKKEKEQPKESLKQINFEVKKKEKRGGWTVNPAIPQEIVNHIIHIISHGLDLGIIKMEKFTLTDGRIIGLSFEMKSRGLIIGSIVEKETKQKTTKPASPGSTGSKGSKEDKLKTMIGYLVDNENFSNWLINEFFEYWKPLIDDGFISSGFSGR
jgi:hypothetical protein